MDSGFRSIFFKIFDSHLDLLVCFFASFFSFVLFFISYSKGSSSTAEMGFVFFSACLLYLFFRKKILTDKEYTSFRISKKCDRAINISFLLLYSLSLIIAHSELYLPQAYFVILMIMVFITVLEIQSENSEFFQWKVLSKIILLALNIRYSVFFEFPGVSGADAWIHMNIIETIIKSNYIVYFVNSELEIYNFYQNLPNMHLLVVITKIITDMPYKESLFLSIGLIFVIGILFIFLLNSADFNKKWAYLAALVISILPIFNSWGEILIPNTLGIILYCIILYLVLQKNSDKRFLTILLFFIFASIYTHTVSPFITAILLCSLLIFDTIYKRIFNERNMPLNLNIRIVLVFFSALTIKWAYEAYNQTSNRAYSFVELVLPSFADMLVKKTSFVGDIIYAPAASPLNRIWFLICLLFMTIGIFYFLAKKYRNNVTFSIAFSLIMLSGIVIFFTIFNVISLMPHRWVIFILILGSPLLIAGMYGLANLLENKFLKANILVVIIIIIFAFFSLFSATVNSNSPFSSESVRSEFTSPELDALSTITEYNTDLITTDYDYGAYPLKNMYSRNFAQLNVHDDPTDLVVLRNYIIHHEGFLYYRPQVRENIAIDLRADEVLNSFQTPQFDLFFDNGGVFGYKKRTIFT